MNNTQEQQYKRLLTEFHNSKTIMVPVGSGKTPIRKWMKEDKSGLNLDIDWTTIRPSELERVAIAFEKSNEDNIMVIDIDTADSAALKLVESIIKEYNGSIIAYPTRKGAHLWFKIPEGFKDGKWWSGRKVGYVTKTGIGPVDYLNGGLINVGLRSAVTGEVELLTDTSKFGIGEINQPMKALFENNNFTTLPLSQESFNKLPELDIKLYPLKKPGKEQTIEDIVFSTAAGRNTEAFTSWAGQLNMKSELNDDVIGAMEISLNWMNDNLTGDAWFEDLEQVIDSVYEYDNEFCTEPYKADGKLRKERQERKQREEAISSISQAVNLSGKEVDWTGYFEIKDTQKLDIAKFLIEALDIRLLNGTTLVLRRGEKDIVKTDLVAASILATRPSCNVDVAWARKIMEIMIHDLKLEIEVNDRYEYVAEYVQKPLWVDRNGLVINPFDLLDENNEIKIMTRKQAGIDTDVVPFHLNLDFNKLPKFSEKAFLLFEKWINNAVDGNKEKFDYFFRYYGYTFMIGKKFTRQVGFIGGVTQSGKSTLEDIINKTVIGKGNTGKANNNIFKSEFGLQPIAGKSRAVLDEGASAFSGNSEDFKTITAAETILVNPKGSAAYESFIPKITVLFNHLPEELDYSDEAVLNRLAMIYLEKPLSNDFNDETQTLLTNQGGEAFFIHVLNAYKGMGRADITTADKSDKWKSPFMEVLREHIDVGNFSEFFVIQRIRDYITIEDRTYEQITTEIHAMDTIIGNEAKQFIMKNRYNLGKALRYLGYDNKNKAKVWKKI